MTKINGNGSAILINNNWTVEIIKKGKTNRNSQSDKIEFRTLEIFFNF